MSFEDEPRDDEDCGRPCDPNLNNGCCADYWARMIREGYWKDGKGWTAKGMKEMSK